MAVWNSYIARTINQAHGPCHIDHTHVDADAHILAFDALQRNDECMLYCYGSSNILEFEVLDAVLLVVVQQTDESTYR
jgi:hypothetical protein